MKKCGRCGEVKELGEFHKAPRNADGHFNVCKICKKEKDAERYQENKTELARQHAEYNITAPGKYAQLKGSAKRRGLEMSITLEQYETILAAKKCYYCDDPIKGTTGHSLNRIDNAKGYTIENVKPCCGTCNKIMNNFTLEELKSKVYKIIKRMERARV